MEEEWRMVDEFPSYEVSNLGRVRSIQRTITQMCRWGKMVDRLMRSVVLKDFPAFGGYLYVKLGLGPKRNRSIHRLVAKAFLPSIEGCPAINHLNGDKTNNRVDNLEWVSCSMNAKHATRVLGKRGGQFGPNRVRYPAGTIIHA